MTAGPTFLTAFCSSAEGVWLGLGTEVGEGVNDGDAISDGVGLGAVTAGDDGVLIGVEDGVTIPATWPGLRPHQDIAIMIIKISPEMIARWEGFICQRTNFVARASKDC